MQIPVYAQHANYTSVMDNENYNEKYIINIIRRNVQSLYYIIIIVIYCSRRSQSSASNTLAQKIIILMYNITVFDLISEQSA